VIGGVVKEVMREGKVSGSNPTDRVARDLHEKTRDLRLAISLWAFHGIKIFFPISKNRFHIF